MTLEVVKYPAPSLKQPCEPVGTITDELRTLVADMTKTMYANEGIGLAAPQVGRNIRLVVIDLSGPDEQAGVDVYINPTLEPVGDDYLESEEGCLSVVDYRAMVKRHASVRVKATDLEGNTIDKVAHDLEAICLQHECDHLDGKVFLDRISRLKRTLYDSKLKKQAKIAAATAANNE